MRPGKDPIPAYGGLIETPLGNMIALLNEQGALQCLEFLDEPWQQVPLSSWRGVELLHDSQAVAPIASQLQEYFAGRRRVFDLSLAPRGNDFLQEAWRHLREVPYGTTLTYGALAQRLERRTSARAIGRANAVNPIAIIVPCHRIIGADGSLTGYAGGLVRKQALLELEGGYLPARQRALW
ncbi:methylated-DNA--[protein]-cysteine S-methyltransferase [Aquipseudomonas alcaligenes]|uniref:Methylated-DNA--protein-cysteine methyltransferase n=1 Tax=Aquipseudomonas alcaligenes TaxID=43263 RepID=A0A2V4L8V7_AQUAC|nr:methylated-DNA--[protein]-cysteine S-methyltransferase [Pseudomonas alcaligenes]PYC28198.1 methylated-DNA--[protein]-cysteine S-methyltransferase [Pseudomonas alcaligenes]